MKKFLDDLKTALQQKKMKKNDIDEIIADHEEMIKTAIEEGLTEEELEKKFGDPNKLADELSGAQSTDSETANATEDYTLWKQFEVKEDTFKSYVRLVSEDVVYQLSEDDTIRVYAKGKHKLDDYKLTFDSGTLSLEAPSQKSMWFFTSKTPDINFIITMPKQVAIDKFDHKSVNADVKISHLKIKSCIFNTVNGDAEISQSDIEDLRVSTVNGDMAIENIQGTFFKSSQVSGDLVLKSSQFKDDVMLSTVSGDVEVQDVTCEICHFGSVSGDILAQEFYPKKVSLKSVSGDITIKNNKDQTIDIIKKSSVSGTIHIK